MKITVCLYKKHWDTKWNEERDTKYDRVWWESFSVKIWRAEFSIVCVQFLLHVFREV